MLEELNETHKYGGSIWSVMDFSYSGSQPVTAFIARTYPEMLNRKFRWPK